MKIVKTLNSINNNLLNELLIIILYWASGETVATGYAQSTRNNKCHFATLNGTVRPSVIFLYLL